jgi:hypothetical protein
MGRIGSLQFGQHGGVMLFTGYSAQLSVNRFWRRTYLIEIKDRPIVSDFPQRIFRHQLASELGEI